MRTLIAIVAFEAEHHIIEVLRRIPKTVWNSPDYHVLLSDDASSDRTVEIAQKQLQQLGTNYNILKLSTNQGYGGNQKICYRFAIKNSFDSVILLHGDCQYPPELVIKIADSLRLNDAHVVLGSRMMTKRMALKGGMPFYKLISNILLTRLQNLICQSNLSEFHTGYRAYSTSLLGNIPFEINSDNFDFDTEILLQAFHYRAKIHELPIPTHYGNEICRVPGIKYAFNILRASLRYRLQKMGLMVSLQYPYSAKCKYNNKLNDPNSSHSIAVNWIAEDPLIEGASILDVGCGEGYLAAYLRSAHNAKITGIDICEPATTVMDNFARMDLDHDEWDINISKYDLILLLDVLEHLSSPETFLIKLRQSVKADNIPKLIISVPNIAFIILRINLLFGQFNYADRGILDITHKRLFTHRTFRRLLRETGFQILRMQGIGIPLAAIGTNYISLKIGSFSATLARYFPSFFGFQLIAEIKPKLATYEFIE
jgi:2-polyprenyl-3-methyl-5-hydroxy-6-metoxy-1,4-benzoquinol methylase